MAQKDYVIRVHQDLGQLDPAAWNALLDAQHEPTPFMRHEYLAAMQRSASATPQTGWSAEFLTLTCDDELRAAMPLYLKDHSYGEYVFDWAWAEAYQRHGLSYYPKLLAAPPFTPVPGTRLLARDDEDRHSLIAALNQHARDRGVSSAHLLFFDDKDRAALQAAGWMIRQGMQFHWQQDRQAPATDFDSLLSCLQRDKRKKIQQERRRVAEQGVHFSAYEGQQISPALWDFFYRCYVLTYAAHHSTPYLSRSFFDEMAIHMPRNWVMFVAEQQGEPIAASLVAIDPDRKVAWGRYWGCVQPVSCLHFEACYYQPLAWCLRQGYRRFEGGAQGEHKMARGLLPVATYSAHWLQDQRFAQAVANFLAQEGKGMAGYVDELRGNSPFKAVVPAARPPAEG